MVIKRDGETDARGGCKEIRKNECGSVVLIWLCNWWKIGSRANIPSVVIEIGFFPQRRDLAKGQIVCEDAMFGVDNHATINRILRWIRSVNGMSKDRVCPETKELELSDGDVFFNRNGFMNTCDGIRENIDIDRFTERIRIF